MGEPYVHCTIIYCIEVESTFFQLSQPNRSFYIESYTYIYLELLVLWRTGAWVRIYMFEIVQKYKHKDCVRLEAIWFLYDLPLDVHTCIICVRTRFFVWNLRKKNYMYFKHIIATYM